MTSGNKYIICSKQQEISQSLFLVATIDDMKSDIQVGSVDSFIHFTASPSCVIVVLFIML